MKTSISYAILAAAAACGFAQAQTTAYTTPVGYISLGNVTPAAANLPNNTDIYFGAPLVRSAEWAGLATATTATTVTIGSNAWTASQWVAGAGQDPYIVQIEDGTLSGLQALITGNTQNELTVLLQPGISLSGAAANTKFTIRKANTPSSLFPGSALPSGVSILLYESAGQNLSFSNSLLYLGANSWENQADLSEAANFPIYNGEAFVLRNESGSSVADLTISGEVPTSNSRVVFEVSAPAGQDALVAYNSPVEQSVGTSGLDAVMSVGDELLIYDNNIVAKDKSFSDSNLYLGGGSWELQSDLSDGSLYMLQPGVSYFVRKQPGSATGFYTWSNLPSFVPSL